MDLYIRAFSEAVSQLGQRTFGRTIKYYKWALTEENPLIKAYKEAAWAELVDYTTAPIEMSLISLAALHEKLVFLLKRMKPEDFQRTYIHPDKPNPVSLAETTGIYAWHSNHHYAHIENLLISKGWK